MTTDTNMDLYALAQDIYSRQLQENGGTIETEKYFWKLGDNVARKLKAIPYISSEGATLFGIQVRFDVLNPEILQLFKDVT